MFGANPIPVGHRIEVFTLAKDIGVFGKDVQPQPDEPLVHDLTSGVWFGRTWHFASNGTDLSEPRSATPGVGTQIVERFVGVVKECIVASYGYSSAQCMATTRHIDVD